MLSKPARFEVSSRVAPVAFPFRVIFRVRRGETGRI